MTYRNIGDGQANKINKKTKAKQTKIMFFLSSSSNCVHFMQNKQHTGFCA